MRYIYVEEMKREQGNGSPDIGNGCGQEAMPAHIGNAGHAGRSKAALNVSFAEERAIVSLCPLQTHLPPWGLINEAAFSGAPFPTVTPSEARHGSE